MVTDINAVEMTHEDDDDQGERMINEGMEKTMTRIWTNRTNTKQSTRHGRKTARSCMT